MKVLLFGGSGFLGSHLKNFFLEKKVSCFSCGRNSKNDILLRKYSEKEIFKIIFDLKPDVVVNLVGITNVDECEKNLKKAREINTNITKNISNVLIKYKKKIFFLHISTDQVYDSINSKESKTCLVNNYAKTKKKAEEFVIKVNGCVVRTNFFGFSKSKKTFLDWVYISLKKGKKINLFSNIYFSPLYVKTLCHYLLKIIRKKKFGIYNVGSKGCISKAEFGLYFAHKMKLNKNLIQVMKFKKGMLLAKRPNFMCMNVSKFERSFSQNTRSCYKEINLAVKYKNQKIIE
tara:strand:+ start:215 stop:1081 length:867 start_codon:yes stop_codon:yes gene_type:complete